MLNEIIKRGQEKEREREIKDAPLAICRRSRCLASLSPGCARPGLIKRITCQTHTHTAHNLVCKCVCGRVMGCCVPLDGLWWWCPLVCTHYTHFTLHRPSSSPNQKGEEEGSRKKAKVAALSLLCVYFAVPHNSVRPRYIERIRQNSTLRPFEPPPTSHLFFFFFFFFFFF